MQWTSDGHSRSINMDIPIASSSSSFPRLGESTSTTATAVNGSGSAAASSSIRPFRSRKHRPCDLCRKRRSRCAIPEQGSACIECLQTGKACTFLDQPVDRKEQLARKRQKSAQKSPSSATSVPLPEFNGLNTLPTGVTEAQATFSKTPPLHVVGDPSAENISLQVSLEATATFDALEPTAITAMLTDDLLPVSAGATDASQGAVTSHFQISSDRSRPTFFVLPDIPEYRRARGSENHSLLLEHILSALDIASIRSEVLKDEYISIVHPAMPVLSHQLGSRLGEVPSALLAMIIGKSLESAHELPHLRKHIWHMIKQDVIGDNALRTPTLSSLAVATLELSACPSLDARNDYMLLAKAIAHAQLLGLHLASGRWRIPTWESEQRERLWWSLRIHDAWVSFLHSRPSHLQPGNSNVPIPSVPTYISRTEANHFASFSYNCRLSLLINRLQNGLCLVERSGEASRNAKIRLCEQLQEELVILEDEIVPLVATNGSLPGMANFQLLLYGFHCMVHRVSIELRIGLGTAFLPDRQSLLIFKKFVDFIVNIPTRQGFWLPYASHVLSSVLSSLIRLSLAIVIHNGGAPKTSTQNYGPVSPVMLISELCRAVLPSGEHSWAVASAAAQRAHNVAERLRSVRGTGDSDEYADLLQALQGKLLAERTDPLETVDFDALFRSLAPPPPSEHVGIFPDPSFSWSNLDIWLSNLDGNGLPTFETFDNDGALQTDYA